MTQDLLKLYDQASAWTTEKVAGAKDKLDGRSTCDEWNLRTLLDHMLETQRYFASSARGEDASPPSGTPPATLSSDPASDFESARQDVLSTFGEDGVIERTGPSLGIAFSDMLIHGWDVAQSSGQDARMPEGLAEAAYEMVHGKFTDAQRKGTFKPEVSIGADASPQDRLLAYTGRDPRVTST
jgi:uncharacterized protein (TIGR03086 family)